MKSRGRKSSASLTVVPLGLDARRPAPPDTLTEVQASMWRAVWLANKSLGMRLPPPVDHWRPSSLENV